MMFKELRSLNEDDVISFIISGNIPLSILIKEFNALKYTTDEITEYHKVGEFIKAIEKLPIPEIKKLQHNFKRELDYINHNEVDNKHETDDEHSLKIWVIKTVIKWFVLVSSILIIGVISDSIVNPEKDNLKLIMEIFSSYGSILNIALGMK